MGILYFSFLYFRFQKSLFHHFLSACRAPGITKDWCLKKYALLLSADEDSPARGALFHFLALLYFKTDTFLGFALFQLS